MTRAGHGRHALTVMPFALARRGEANAYFRTVQRLDAALAELGYTVHAVAYHPFGATAVGCRDEFHYVPAVSPRAFKWNRDEHGGVLLDSQRNGGVCAGRTACWRSRTARPRSSRISSAGRR